jgi:hypothetical protein
MQIKVIAIAVGVAFITGAAANSGISKDEYKSTKEGIAAEYKSARAACGSLSANARDICVAEAVANEKVARADLEARYRPSGASVYKLRLAQADADYAVAMETCDESSGSAKAICVKDAKAALAAAKARARTRTASAANEGIR